MKTHDQMTGEAETGVRPSTSQGHQGLLRAARSMDKARKDSLLQPSGTVALDFRLAVLEL